MVPRPSDRTPSQASPAWLLLAASVVGALAACPLPLPATPCADADDCPAGYACAEGGYCIAEEPGPVAIVSFTAEPETISWGEQVVLRWETRNARSCRLNHESVEVSGSLTRQPVASRHFELVCMGEESEDRRELEVRVTCAAPTTLMIVSGSISSAQQLSGAFEIAEGCFRVEGDLIIHGSSDIEDLAPLFGVVEIDGNLMIVGNSALTSLHGLEGLVTVTGSLMLGDWDDVVDDDVGNPALVSLRGLSGLRSVQGELAVQHSPLLESLGGLEELLEVGDGFEIDALPLVSDLRPLRRLKTVGGKLELDDLRLIEEVVGLDALASVGAFSLDDMPALRAVAALPSLQEVGSIYLSSNGLLTDLSGLSAVRGVSGTFDLYDNDSLASIDALAQVFAPTLERLIVGSNEQLAALDALAGVSAVFSDEPIATCNRTQVGAWRCPGSVKIHDNPRLTDIDGLAGLTSVSGDLALLRNNALASVAALDGVVELDGSLQVESNGALQDIALNPTCAFSGASFTVIHNPYLPQQEALDLAADWTANNPGCAVTVEDNGNG